MSASDDNRDEAEPGVTGNQGASTARARKKRKVRKGRRLGLPLNRRARESEFPEIFPPLRSRKHSNLREQSFA